MNVIIPMAGMGKRLRPHTLTTPKPLLPVAGKPIVQHLVEDIVRVSHQKVNEIAYVVGQFGEEAENKLLAVAKSLGAKGSIHYQDQALGTAHAILCAQNVLEGPVTVAFADTLFRADFALDNSVDGVLWVQKIADPRQFGVVIVNEQGVITGFSEKPQTFVSDLAMIGIYYFKNGAQLKTELQYLIDHHITNGGEYQLPDALRNMMSKGLKFAPGAVNDWMDCGNKDAMVETNQKMLGYLPSQSPSPSNLTIQESTIVQPCFIGNNVVLKNSVVGPFVSLGDETVIENAEVTNSIILRGAKIKNAVLTNSMIGSFAEYEGDSHQVSLGDFSVLKN
jgi:glucose-1-phosphate thymidylyltransferase